MATAQDLRATHRVDERVKGFDDKIDAIIDGARFFFVFCHVYFILTGAAARYRTYERRTSTGSK